MAAEGKTKISPEKEHPMKVSGWAAHDTSGVLSPFNFSRRATGDKDVVIKILYCGICHSDLHCAKNEWKNTTYPIVPGHEIAGLVTEVGHKVTKFRVGDRVGVGCMIGSCSTCEDCKKNDECYCTKVIFTYNNIYHDGTITYGGYSEWIVADERFVIGFPESLPLDKGAPLLCAGITVYSPMRQHGLDVPGMRVGVVGLGGLGHVAVKFGKALGMRITVISTSPRKEEEALGRLGADAFLVSSDPEQMKAAAGTLDGIINTVSANHDVSPLMFLLKTHGKMVMVGIPEHPPALPVLPLIAGGRVLAGSSIGGMEQTQEMINFAAEHGVTADIELIQVEYMNEAMKRLAKADVRYRFVVDIANSFGSASA